MRKKTKTEYEKLRDKWYEKLRKAELKKPEEERFVDIEQDEDNLKAWSTSLTYRNTHKEIEEKQKYHDMATAFLEQYKFDSKRDRIIWEYHCNGLSGDDIVTVLKKVRVKISQVWVDKIIKRLKIKMFDMMWAPLKEYHEGTDE